MGNNSDYAMKQIVDLLDDEEDKKWSRKSIGIAKDSAATITAILIVVFYVFLAVTQIQTTGDKSSFLIKAISEANLLHYVEKTKKKSERYFDLFIQFRLKWSKMGRPDNDIYEISYIDVDEIKGDLYDGLDLYVSQFLKDGKLKKDIEFTFVEPDLYDAAYEIEFSYDDVLEFFDDIDTESAPEEFKGTIDEWKVILEETDAIIWEFEEAYDVLDDAIWDVESNHDDVIVRADQLHNVAVIERQFRNIGGAILLASPFLVLYWGFMTTPSKYNYGDT